ncbi:equilibrative nucleotide transporter 8-like [Telopea speciosissima]|uniref:equilibrative nucleotide transporter 8-like n=1 Tax=Telopea speciosissima TaxID=54955 RepID=UPI001CC44447|nr:equilibrative nucleotide transporter 8-like [Telopea speciosissima]
MEGVKSLCDQTEPRDAFNMAYIIHFVLGAANLLPWNALITAVDYFGYLYPDEHVNKVFAVAYMGSSLPVLVLFLSWGSWNKKSSFRLRMNLGLSMFILSVMTPPLIDWTSHSSGPQKRLHGAYTVTVAAVAVCGLADGLIGGSLIGSAGKLPKRYMQAVFAGTASSGVLVSIMRIITKASLPQTPEGLRLSAHLYFVVSTLIVMGCIVCCNILDRLPVMQKYQCKITMAPRTLISGFSDNPQSSMRMLFEVDEPEQPKFWDVMRKIRWPAFGILMIYTVTLSIFPGYIAEDVHSKVLRDWYQILLITMYNVSDLAGKSLTAVYVPKTIAKTTWASIFRLLFYPLFTACLHGPKWFRTEVPVVFLTTMLGLSNGYLTSVFMILAPKSVLVAEAETASIVMALFLAFGLVIGSILGWFWII